MRWFHYGLCSLSAMAFLSTPVFAQARTEKDKQTRVAPSRGANETGSSIRV